MFFSQFNTLGNQYLSSSHILSYGILFKLNQNGFISSVSIISQL